MIHSLNKTQLFTILRIEVLQIKIHKLWQDSFFIQKYNLVQKHSTDIPSRNCQRYELISYLYNFPPRYSKPSNVMLLWKGMVEILLWESSPHLTSWELSSKVTRCQSPSFTKLLASSVSLNMTFPPICISILMASSLETRTKNWNIQILTIFASQGLAQFVEIH